MRAFLLILLIIASSCWAEQPKQLHKAVIGIYPTSIHELNYANESYKISFYLWVITNLADYDPRKTLEIVNAYDYEYKNYIRNQRKDGKYLHVMHIYATVYHNWQVANFPFDKQSLAIRVEDGNNFDEIQFHADKKESAVSNQFFLEDWQIMGLDVSTKIHTYNTSFGSFDGKRDKYSQFMAKINIQRQGARLFFNFYIGFIVSFLISSFVFFIEPGEIRPRASFTLAALFGAVGNKYIIDRYLPVVDHFTLNDAIQVAAFGLILTTAFITIITYHIHKTNRKKAEVINFYTGIISVPLFVLFYSFFFIKALLM